VVSLQPYEPDGIIPRLTEITDFASVLSTAIPAHDTDVITLAVDTVGDELRELTERFPPPKNTSVSGGWDERRLARAALKGLVLSLRRIGLAGSVGHFDEAMTEYANFRKLLSSVPGALQNAEPWSLFNPAIHEAHYSALRKMYEAAENTAR
jgi:hypothetical protein